MTKVIQVDNSGKNSILEFVKFSKAVKEISRFGSGVIKSCANKKCCIQIF